MSQPTQQQERELLDRLAAYCQRHGPECYANWSPETLRDYLAFHCDQRTFAYVQTSGQLAGTGVMWQCDEAEIRAKGKRLFDWQPTNPAGDSLFLADFVCTVPGALSALVRAFKQRFPDWDTRKIFTYRRGELVQFQTAMFTRLFLKGNL